MRENWTRKWLLLVDKDTNEPLIKISPVALNVGENTF